jgi:hypothetical protein
MEKLRNDSVNIINFTDTSFIRDFARSIDWNDRLIGIKGARGVGKTTLLLQYIKQNLPISQTLYVSLDNIYFSSNLLVDLADEFVKIGGAYLVLDEVHRYSNWSIEIKNIYDTHKNLKVIFTGSSILNIDHKKADLSRRVVFYEMPGFSLREYVNIKTDNSFEAISFEAILSNHQEFSINIVKHVKPIALYNDYIRTGYYPFFLENEATYHKKIEEIINVVMEIDIPQSFKISLHSIEKMKKLLYIISSSTPFKPNIVKLSEKIGATRNTIKTYLHYLERAKVIQLLQSKTKGVSILQKPEKIYLHHPNLMFAFAHEKSNIGTLRETFFYNQLGVFENLTSSKKADFIVNDKYTIEVGGKNKDKSQIAGIENAFLVLDNIEHGFGNKIPLWLFGFLY